MPTDSIMCDKPDESGFEELVLSVQEKVSRIAYQYARLVPGWFREDLLSVGMAAVMYTARKYLPDLPAARYPQRRDYAYLVVAARRAIMGQYRDGDPMARPVGTGLLPLLSLDAPLAVGADSSLYAVLAHPVVSSNRRDFDLLYEVIDTLSENHREVVCMRFGLRGYHEHRFREIAQAQGVAISTVRCRLDCALVALREHTELLGLVGPRFLQEPIEDDVFPCGTQGPEHPGGAGSDCVPGDVVEVGQ